MSIVYICLSLSLTHFALQSRKPLSARDLERLRVLITELSLNSREAREARGNSIAPPKTSRDKSPPLTSPTVKSEPVSLHRGGPGSLPRADASVASVTLTSSVDDFASKRLDSFVKKEMTRPVDPAKQSTSSSGAGMLDSLGAFSLIPADPQSLWQGLGNIGTAIPAERETELT